MARGERNFSMKGVKPLVMDSTPPPPGEYDAKLHISQGKSDKKNEPGKFPYISFPIELLDTAKREGGKNRVIFHFLHLTHKGYGDNGDFQLFRKADQLAGLCAALGESYEGGVIMMKDENGQKCKVFNPQELLKWLQNFDGQTVKVKTKIQKGTGGYGDKGVIDRFIWAEGDESESEEEDEEDEDEDLEEDDEDGDEDEADEDEEDDEDEDGDEDEEDDESEDDEEEDDEEEDDDSDEDDEEVDEEDDELEEKPKRGVKKPAPKPSTKPKKVEKKTVVKTAKTSKVKAKKPATKKK